MIRFGSARIDENGHITGGKAGDQTGKEVAMQNYYMSSLGWYCLRPKSVDHANKLAKAMTIACENDNIGYNQNERGQVVKSGINTKTKVNADCSSLVRACIIDAMGKDVGNFTTYNEAEVLEKSGLFEKKFKVKSEADLRDGDVCVTCSKGHTVVCVSGNPRVVAPTKKAYPGPFATPTLRKKAKGTQVLYLQKFLNWYFGSEVLVKDGDFGSNTEKYLMKFQAAEKLEVDGVYGPKSCAKAKAVKR